MLATTVLVLLDDAELGGAEAGILRDEGLEAQVATRREDARARLRAVPAPDVLFTDLAFGNDPGAAAGLLAELRADPACTALSLVVMSELPVPPDHPVRALARVLEEPFQLEDLLRAVRAGGPERP